MYTKGNPGITTKYRPLIVDDEPDIHAEISDIKMTGVSGMELANQLRPIDPILPVILITGHSDS